MRKQHGLREIENPLFQSQQMYLGICQLKCCTLNCYILVTRQKYTLSTLPLKTITGSQTTTLGALQHDSQFDIRLEELTTSDTVQEFKAVIFKESTVVNLREFIELVTPYDQMQYGLFLATFNASSGTTHCLVQGFTDAPPVLSGLKEDMSFRERLLSAIIDFGLLMTLPLVNKISECEEALKLGEDYFGEVTLHLTHNFRVEDKENRSVVYISMGSTAELTPEQGRSILGGVMASPHNYSVVWALRESNRNAIEGVKIDPKRTFIASWVSQFTMLQQKAVAMAILHCGIGGVQEALYNKVPVICVPYGKYRILLKGWGVGSLIVREKMSIILRAPGGTKAAADLVELYAEVGHEHGVPAFAKYQWSWVEYYNLDVLGVLAAAIGVFLWMSVKLLKLCCKMC
eukprot:Em0015g1081a